MSRYKGWGVLLTVAMAVACGNVGAGGQGSMPTDPEIGKIVGQIRAENIEHTITTLVSFGTRNTLSVQDDPKRGIGAARDWLAAEFTRISQESGGRLKVELQSFVQPVAARVPKPTKLTNVVATLPGTDPTAEQRVIVVSGHYDSMCTSPIDAEHDAPGANDDASGSAAVVEMARVMSHYKFRATIVFMCVVGEEQGLLGSTYFAEQAKLQNMPIEAMLTNDIIGSSLGANGVHDDHTVRLFSEGISSLETEAQARTRQSVGGEDDSISRQLARFLKENAERYVHKMHVTLVSRRDRYGRGGDHIPFTERGYAAVRFTEPNENYNHQHQNVRVENGLQYGDLPQFDDFPYIANVARVNAAGIAALALAPAPPQGVGISTGRQSPDTDLKWTASSDPNIAGYEIVWRATTEPTWTHARTVGKVAAYTVIGLSKDNYFFGVRAVDKHGHRSPVTFPRPVR
ncbi:MAG: aminopeptidase [Chthonomonadaceae bacterium]|nr:aminopeptidase [Chthonomonadaceae bacterium]